MTENAARCVKCQAVLALQDFPVHRGSRSGRSSWCRECHRALSATGVTETATKRTGVGVRGRQSVARRLPDEGAEGEGASPSLLLWYLGFLRRSMD
jgi:hypothetical protein